MMKLPGKKKIYVLIFITAVVLLSLGCNISLYPSQESTPVVENEIVFVTPIVIEVAPTPIPSPTNALPQESDNIDKDQVIPTPDLPCNAAELIKDLSIPDDTVIPGGESFTKSWMMRNSGSCTWTPSYAVIFAGGDQLGANSYNPILQYVYPGETINISINLVAPLYSGCYQGNWLFQDTDGNRFGVGYNANQFFWVAMCVENENGAGFAPC